MPVYFNGLAIPSLEEREVDKRISENNYASNVREILSKGA
jgi:hypothetical protein